MAASSPRPGDDLEVAVPAAIVEELDLVAITRDG
jgi:hypothetical protein